MKLCTVCARPSPRAAGVVTFSGDKPAPVSLMRSRRLRFIRGPSPNRRRVSVSHSVQFFCVELLALFITLSWDAI